MKSYVCEEGSHCHKVFKGKGHVNIVYPNRRVEKFKLKVVENVRNTKQRQ